MRFRAAARAAIFIALFACVRGDPSQESYMNYDYAEDEILQGTQFNRPTCEFICNDPEEFETPLPPIPRFELNRAHDWSIVILNQIMQNFARLSPPGISRILGVFSSCMHDALATDESFGMAPVYAKNAVSAPGFDLNMDLVLNGAAFTAIKAAFELDASFQGAVDFLVVVSDTGIPPEEDPSFALGATVCLDVIAFFTADGFKVDGDPLPGNAFPAFQPSNPPQANPGITDCGTEISNIDLWQPLCVPTAFGSQDCYEQFFLAPDAGSWTTFSLPTGNAVRPVPPPLFSENPNAFMGQAQEIIDFSAALSDVGKSLAEFWADGPDTTAPAGHWYRIALDAAVKQRLSLDETVKVMFLVGSALHDAGVASWDAKRYYNFARPITMIQCGFAGQTIEAWTGPYLGVGPIPASKWQPFQATTFVTPAFPGYVSGHSTFSAAASRVLELYFGAEYLAPKCRLIGEGRSLFEGRIDPNEAGYIPGLTDVPNRGPQTAGYVPATDVILCWEEWQDAGIESGVSRFHGGIHIRADHDLGVNMGYQIADKTFEIANTFWE